MKKFSKLTKDLPKYILKKIYKNTREQCVRLSINIANQKFSDYRTLINCMFNWYESKEWFDYWKWMSEKKYNKKKFLKKYFYKINKKCSIKK